MSALNRVQSGPQRKPLLVVVYGVPGVGKTTFAASAPAPIVHDLEKGSLRLDVARFEPAPSSWEQFLADIGELSVSEHRFDTYVVDTLDAIEVLAVSHVCAKAKKSTLSDFSYGAGYALLLQEWRIFLDAVEQLQAKKGMHVVLLAHEHRKVYDDPELGSFTMYRPKIQDKTWALTNECADAVLFAQFDQAILEKEGQKARAIVSGRRVLRTQRGTGYVAKNRFSLPETIDLDWKAFAEASSPVGIAELRTRLDAALEKADEEFRTKLLAWVKERGGGAAALRAATERATQRLAEKAA